MFEFKLPDLGEGIHEGEILKWHVQVGGPVKADEPLVDVETDKAAVTIPSPRGGKIMALNGKVGEVVHVGNVITVIDDASGASAAKPAAAAPAAPAHAAPAHAAPAKPAAATPAATSTAPAASVIAAPATRKLARDMGIDIRLVTPSGPAGRVTPEDVKNFKADKPVSAAPAPLHQAVAAAAMASNVEEEEFTPRAAPTGSGIPYLDMEPMPDFSAFGPVEKVQLRSIRRKVARKMTTSSVLIPHVAHMDEADVTDLEALRRAERKRLEAEKAVGAKLTLLAFVVKAVVTGLKNNPCFNASVDTLSEEIIYKKFYNIGIAVDTGKSLVVPVLRDADKKNILQISRDIADLADRARTDKLDAADFKGSTFTITNMGPLGGTNLLPMINYPESAILGMGRSMEKPVVRDGQIVIRTMLPVTLCFDHRIGDGADAAKFVGALVRQLSNPNRLLLET